MIAFFQGIADAFSVLGQFLVAFFSSILDFFSFLSTGMRFVNQFLEYLPTELVAIAGVVVSLSLLFAIIGRI